MDYFARRNLYNNNKSPPILLNDTSYKQKFSKNNISRVTPSYSGNPHLIRNYKTSIYSSKNYFSTNKSQQINNGELINSRFKNNSNYNNDLNNNNSNNIFNYAQNSRYLKPTKSFTAYNNNYLSPNRIKNENSNYNHNIQPPNLRSKILNLSNNYKKKSISKNFSMQYLPIKNNFNFLSPKKKLILDLDETLVHSGFNPFTRQSDISLQINIDGKYHTINILKRPHVDEFLKEISNYYEIYVFTASMEEYASPVIDLIDKNNIIKGKFFRQDCIYNNDLYIKDLFKVTNDLKDVIIIDNNPSSYATNEDNGIPIKTWYDDLNDNELIKLIPVLKYLSNVNDVRSIISQIVDKINNEVDFNIVNRIISGVDSNIDSNVNNKRYENNFYYEINESKIKNKNNNENDKYYSRYDKYKEYNNINSFSNMSYNEIQNEAGHTNNNYNFNFTRFNNFNNKEEEIKYNQRNLNENENIYKHNYNNSFYNGNINLMRSKYLTQEKKDNIQQYNSYFNDMNQNQVNQNNNNENMPNLIYNDKLKKIRPYTPNINRRKMNSFINIESNNYDKKFITGYENNNNIDNQNNENNERESEIKSYYEGRRINQDNNIYKNLYNNNDLKLSTQNILNRSSSDIYLNIKRNDDNLRRYNYLLNMNNLNNNEQRRETETNERKTNYYVQSYKSHLSRINYKPKEYNQNLNNNNNIIKPTNLNIRVNNSTNLSNITQSKNYMDYFNSKYNNNKNNNGNDNMSKNMNEEQNERYNYINSNYNENMNNKRDYLDDMNQFKKQINSRFNNFRDYIRDKRREFLQEENKSRNFEETEIFPKEIESYGKKNYLVKNNMRNFNYSNNINYHIKNYI